jgi:cell wall-associated NlpC family hydrolase
MFAQNIPNYIYAKIKENGYAYIDNGAGKPKVAETFGPLSCMLLKYRPENDVTNFTEQDRAEMNLQKIPTVLIGSNKDVFKWYIPDRYFENKGYLNRLYLYGIFDCYTIVHDYYSREWNLWLPNNMSRPYGWWDKAKNLYFENKPDWVQESSSIQRYDTIIFNINDESLPNHAAVYLGNGKMLHHLETRFSCIEELTTNWKTKIYSVFRPTVILKQIEEEGDKYIEGEDGYTG